MNWVYTEKALDSPHAPYAAKPLYSIVAGWLGCLCRQRVDGVSGEDPQARPWRSRHTSSYGGSCCTEESGARFPAGGWPRGRAEDSPRSGTPACCQSDCTTPSHHKNSATATEGGHRFRLASKPGTCCARFGSCDDGDGAGATQGGAEDCQGSIAKTTGCSNRGDGSHGDGRCRTGGRCGAVLKGRDSRASRAAQQVKKS